MRSSCVARNQPGRAAQIPIAFTAATVFEFLRVRSSASKSQFRTRPPELAYAELPRVRRAAGSAEPMGSDRLRRDPGDSDRNRQKLPRRFGPAAGAERKPG